MCLTLLSRRQSIVRRRSAVRVSVHCVADNHRRLSLPESLDLDCLLSSDEFRQIAIRFGDEGNFASFSGRRRETI
jgi:hypothetical protein